MIRPVAIGGRALGPRKCASIRVGDCCAGNKEVVLEHGSHCLRRILAPQCAVPLPYPVKDCVGRFAAPEAVQRVDSARSTRAGGARR